jgi:hypothetical protein
LDHSNRRQDRLADRRDVSPDLWRRYLGIIARGLAAHPEQEPGLDAPPLAPDQVDHVMSFLKPTRR